MPDDSHVAPAEQDIDGQQQEENAGQPELAAANEEAAVDADGQAAPAGDQEAA